MGKGGSYCLKSLLQVIKSFCKIKKSSADLFQNSMNIQNTTELLLNCTVKNTLKND